MFIKNPNYQDKSTLNKRLQEFGAVIDQYIASMPADQEKISFDDVRAAVDQMGLVDSQGIAITSELLPDGVIDYICQIKKLTVVHD